MKDLCLLAVDDDVLVLESLKAALTGSWSVVTSSRPDSLPDQRLDAALVDVHLSGDLARADGIDVIATLRDRYPRLEIIAMSGNLDRNIMERCLKAGASRFLAKPLSVEELKLTLDKIEALILLQRASSRPSSALPPWIGSGAASRNVQRQIAHLHSESGPILLEGESGTGKEVAAQLIHAQRIDTPFVAVNVAGIPENLFESEFFGHVRGAFTGADQNKMGLSEAAHGGDLFLDEIEALSLPLQAKLLRFLETGEVRRVGAKGSLRIQTRVLAATNRSLQSLVAEGNFREDLLWRLSGKRILLPPLRERLEDLPELVRYFLGLDSFRKKQVSEDAMEALKSYSWPGNVRELRRVCEQLLLIAPLPVIRAEDVHRVISSPTPSANPFKMEKLDLQAGLTTLMNDVEGQIIQMALSTHNDIDEVARVLKISRSSLYKKIKDHNIQWRSTE